MPWCDAQHPCTTPPQPVKVSIKTLKQLLDNLLDSSISWYSVSICSLYLQDTGASSAAHRNPATAPQPMKVKPCMQGMLPWALGLLLSTLAVLGMCRHTQWFEMLPWQPCC